MYYVNSSRRGLLRCEVFPSAWDPKCKHRIGIDSEDSELCCKIRPDCRNCSTNKSITDHNLVKMKINMLMEDNNFVPQFYFRFAVSEEELKREKDCRVTRKCCPGCC